MERARSAGVGRTEPRSQNSKALGSAGWIPEADKVLANPHDFLQEAKRAFVGLS